MRLSPTTHHHHHIHASTTALPAPQVQQHMDRMQQQKEQVAMDKLRQLMPQMGDVVRALALAKSEWDIDRAVSMLRSFQVAHLDKVNALNKVCASLVWARVCGGGGRGGEPQCGNSSRMVPLCQPMPPPLCMHSELAS
jgi:hypothetical protein